MYLSDFQYRKNLNLLCDSLKRGEVVSLRFSNDVRCPECRCSQGPQDIEGIFFSSVLDEFDILLDEKCDYAVFHNADGWSITIRITFNLIRFTFQKMF